MQKTTLFYPACKLWNSCTLLFSIVEAIPLWQVQNKNKSHDIKKLNFKIKDIDLVTKKTKKMKFDKITGTYYLLVLYLCSKRF